MSTPTSTPSATLVRPSPYATQQDATTLTLQRLLPGTPERVWAYLTESDLRRRWLAAGSMQPAVKTAFELVWRNDELSASASERSTCMVCASSNRRIGTLVALACALLTACGGGGDPEAGVAGRGCDHPAGRMGRRQAQQRVQGQRRAMEVLKAFVHPAHAAAAAAGQQQAGDVGARDHGRMGGCSRSGPVHETGLIQPPM